MSDGVNTLSLVVRVSQGVPTTGWPELVLVVDGAELFTDADEGMGADPWDLTGEDSPLLSHEPRDVTVRVCDCGEPGCGSVQVRVRREGTRWMWDRWTGSLNVSHELPSLVFDADAYESLVRTPLRPAWPGRRRES